MRRPLLTRLANGVFKLEPILDAPEIMRVEIRPRGTRQQRANLVRQDAVQHADCARRPKCQFNSGGPAASALLKPHIMREEFPFRRSASRRWYLQAFGASRDGGNKRSNNHPSRQHIGN